MLPSQPMLKRYEDSSMRNNLVLSKWQTPEKRESGKVTRAGGCVFHFNSLNESV